MFQLIPVMIGARGGAVVETLRYKPEGRGFDSTARSTTRHKRQLKVHWRKGKNGSIKKKKKFPMVSEFFIDIILWPHNGPGADSASNRNDYQEYFLGVKVAGA
jgi:hypothetical protein